MDSTASDPTNYDHSNFEPSEFFEFGDGIDEDPAFVVSDDWIDEDPAFVVSGYPQNSVFAVNEEVGDAGGGSSSHNEGRTMIRDASGREKKEVKEKIAFKTKSEVEILDDGYKWRKYGKKMVKNSPNPRNYYRCSVEGCLVKKRVERDREDPTYVITTYEGVHNHQGPSKF